MTPHARNRLLLLGALWGLALAAVPALVMADPYRVTGFLAATLASAAVSGAVGTLVAGRRAVRRASAGKTAAKGALSWLLSGVKNGVLQGLIGGAVVALLFWALMAVTISGFTLKDTVEVSVLMSPRVFLGSFFVALSAFVYALVGGLILGPFFGPLVERAVGGSNAGDDVRGKEGTVVR